eukprot:Clim_evm1s32 gene=Clim_evmTU1s32
MPGSPDLLVVSRAGDALSHAVLLHLRSLGWVEFSKGDNAATGLRGSGPVIHAVQDSPVELRFVENNGFNLELPIQWQGATIKSREDIDRIVTVDVHREFKGDPAELPPVPCLFKPSTGVAVGKFQDIVDTISSYGRKKDGDFLELFDPESKLGDESSLILYRSILDMGFPDNQKNYEQNRASVCLQLDHTEKVLGEQRFIGHNDILSVNDMLLYAILVRLDSVYAMIYKLSRTRLKQYQNAKDFAYDITTMLGGAGLNWDSILETHYCNSFSQNPRRLTPAGAVSDFMRPHGRLRFIKEPWSIATHTAGADTKDVQGKGKVNEFTRKDSAHRNWIGSEEFPPESGRYHLYIAYNCPWCHRAAVGRTIMGLEKDITMDVLWYRRSEDRGWWQFRPDKDRVCTPDTVNGKQYIPEIYQMEGSTERSVPILFDKKLKKIVSNESSEILRMMETQFKTAGLGKELDLYPIELQAEIDSWNTYIYTYINNGAYRTGFSASNEVYEKGFRDFYRAIATIEDQLSDGRHWLCGSALTEADVRLFPTIFRMDEVYYLRMLLNGPLIATYPHISKWLERIQDVPGVMEGSNMDHCRKGYFGRTGNGIVPF